MRFTRLFIFCALLLVLCFRKGMGLKCRTNDHHETNDRFERVMQRCRTRIHNQNQNMDNEDSSEEDSAQDDSYDDLTSTSKERDSNKKFINGRFGTTDASSTRNSNPNDNRNQNNNGGRFEQNLRSTSRPYPYNRMTNGSYGTDTASNDRLSQNMTLRSGSYNGMANSGRDNMQTNSHDQACVIQCFFDELSLVSIRNDLETTDQKGFPDKFAVAKIMKQSIRDSELQDFVEGAVMDCFNILDADRKKEPCKSSQHLLSCLANKGRERCEDWDM